ncbi:MAG: hypothetical protein QOG85_1322 [Gaiellaceae bacterium]|jgi:hypothetical protein|nr:hypothetical protein [Gaiellaceae bacterium]
MAKKLTLLALAGVVLVWGGVAIAARTADPPRGSWSGRYKVTVKITNTASTATHWIYGVQTPCSSPCRSFTFRVRLVSETSWRNVVEPMHWNGRSYAYKKTFLKASNCRAKSGAVVKDGYDVIATHFHPLPLRGGE